jgi:hypothetical protein
MPDYLDPLIGKSVLFQHMPQPGRRTFLIEGHQAHDLMLSLLHQVIKYVVADESVGPSQKNSHRDLAAFMLATRA